MENCFDKSKKREAKKKKKYICNYPVNKKTFKFSIKNIIKPKESISATTLIMIIIVVFFTAALSCKPGASAYKIYAKEVQPHCSSPH